VKKTTIVAAVIAVGAIGVAGVRSPAAWAPAVGKHCASIHAGGYNATHVFVDYMPCSSARNKLRRWLRRDQLPRNRSGWYCYRLGDPVWSCGYPGKSHVRMDFTFWL
jgi:hypothetical protein